MREGVRLPRGLGFRVRGVRCRVKGSGFRVWSSGLGFRAWDCGRDAGLRVPDVAFRMSAVGSGSKFRLRI